MMPISFSAPSPNADEAYKVKVATQQINKLLDRVNVNTLYRTLSPHDRSLLVKEGNVQVLVENLVFLTQRVGLQDKIIIGFNDLAFDKSLFASDAVFSNLLTINKRCCAYCERYFDDSLDAVVSHIKPIALNLKNEFFSSGQYAGLAYNYENLVLLCSRCAQQNTQYSYDNLSKYSGDGIASKDLLINPYLDNPREFIRFNPVNGLACAWDAFSDFSKLLDNKSNQIKSWDGIPDAFYGAVHTNNDNALENSNSESDKLYSKWILDKNLENFKGWRTIQALQLNRPSLVVSRLLFGNNLWSLLKSYLRTEVKSDFNSDKNILEFYQDELGAIHQFRSYALDLIEYYHAAYSHKSVHAVVSASDDDAISNDNSLDASISPSSSDISHNSDATEVNVPVCSDNSTVFPVKLPTISEQFQFEVPFWIKSLLGYMVLERELSLDGKRRIVSLTAADYLYGADGDHKCVFLAIDWQKDINNVIKVRNDKHVWETSFKELASSSRLEILQLFAANELWAEGDYLPLSKP